jgi:hypothetical protein
LLKALELQSVDEVSRVLREDPKAAEEVFLEPRVEYPLNAAVRLRCSTEILQLLLAAGADPGTMDSSGRTAKDRLLWEMEADATLEAALRQEAIQPRNPAERVSVAQQSACVGGWETFIPSTFDFGMFGGIPEFDLFAQAPLPPALPLPTGIVSEPFQYPQAFSRLHVMPGFPMSNSLPAQTEKPEDIWRCEALHMLEARDATEVD